jgi:hypothetical protein
VGNEHRKWLGSRWVRAAASLMIAMGTLTALQVVTAAPAGAATGLQKVSSAFVGPDSRDVKTAKAVCPAGKRVVSGGGLAQASAVDQTKVQLTELLPVHPASGPDFFEVTANEVSPGITSNWTLLGFAMCADPISGLHIVSFSSFNRAQSVQVFCPQGEVVLGAGGRIDTPLGHVAMSGVYPYEQQFGPRVQVDVSTDTFGYTGDWIPTVYAVCAPAPAGYQIVFTNSTQPPSAPVKTAFVDCPSGKRSYGLGGATFFGLGQPGVGLQTFNVLNSTNRTAASAGPAGPVIVPDWGPVQPVAICAA